MATETLAFLCEMPKSHDLGHVRGHVIRMSKLPKIAKIDSVRPAVPHYSRALSCLVCILCIFAYRFVFVVIVRKRLGVKNKLKKSNGCGFGVKEVGNSAFAGCLGSHLKGS